MKRKRSKKPVPDPVRHESHCGICAHPKRQEIEQAFIDWVPQSKISKDFKLSGRLCVARHARAFGLVARRNQNIKSVLAGFIERAQRVRPTAQSFIAAIVAFSKLDADGRSVERIESVNQLNSLFARMTRAEAEEYAKSGKLPTWWLPDTPQREGDSPNG